MKRIPASLPRWALVLSIVLTMLACSFLQGPATEIPPSSAPENSTEPSSTGEPVQDQTSTEDPMLDEPDPLDYLLDLRSIRLDLVTLYPDGTSQSTQVEIDAAGNMYVKFTTPGVALPDELKDSEMPALPTYIELYVVDGNTYHLDTENKWEAALEPIDYKVELLDQLHGPEGPGLWLDILTEESLQSAGQETVGGFTTSKYNVNGMIDNQTITGILWYDIESHALVQAELHVPAALLSVSEEPVQGELKITLETQKADVPTITVPTK